MTKNDFLIFKILSLLVNWIEIKEKLFSDEPLNSNLCIVWFYNFILFMHINVNSIFDPLKKNISLTNS